MQRLRILSAVEQVAEYLKNGLAAGVWRGEMPGVVALAGEIGVNHKTVEAALSVLERENVLIGQGARRPRRIASLAVAAEMRMLRIGLLLYDVTDSRSEVVLEIRHLLHEAGHAPFVAKHHLVDLETNAGKLAARVGKHPADAWLALSAPRDVLEWFVAERIPVFALDGRFRRLPVAGAAPDKTAAYAMVVRTLAGLGHQRIVLLARPHHRQPVPSQSVMAFLGALAGQGIAASDYHYPLWENTREGFQRCLVSLFRGAPPTALVVQEVALFGAVQQFLEARGIRVPRDVSLVCTDPDSSFLWRIPTVAHMRWDNRPMVRRVLRWADSVALGKDDRRQLLTKAEFMQGGTIGPAASGFRAGS
jgi:DNA-binding LacI/PurR family transcriptional regulator